MFEAFVFYEAIRDRGYFHDEAPMPRLKKLRYYARFTVVAILMGKYKLTERLVRELEVEVGNNSRNSEAEDVSEWKSMICGINGFLKVST